MKTIYRPQEQEYAAFYKTYIDKIETEEVVDFLTTQSARLLEICTAFTEEFTNFKYEEGKWTVKELIGHCIDTERIMAYRLLRISRGDQTSLAGFDENEYVKNANFNSREWSSILEEFRHMRSANILLLNSLSEEQLSRIGKANELSISARALVYIIAGHLEHHLDILIRRYIK